MAIQENVTLSKPLFINENTNVTRVIEKGRKKQEKELAHLGAILQLVEKEVAAAKSGAIKQEANYGEKIVNLQTGNTNPNQGPSNNQFEAAMDSMVMALQMLQVLIAKYGNDKANQDGIISEAEINLAKSNLKDIEKKLKEIQKKQEHEKTANFWEKFAEYTLGALTILVGVMLAQPELVMMGALSIAGAAGAFKVVTNDLVEPLLIDCGVPKKTAGWLAPLIVCVAVIAGSVIGCDPEMGLEETAEAGVEIGEDVTEDAVSTSYEEMDVEDGEMNVEEDSVAKSDNSLKRFGRDAKEVFSKVNKFLGPQGRMGIMSSMTMLSNTEFVQKAYNTAAMNDGVSAKKRKKIEQEIGIAIAIASMVATIAMGVGAASAGGAVSKAATVSVKTAKLLKTGLKCAMALGIVGEASAVGATGIITIQEGKLKKELAKNQANFILLKTLLEMNTTETREDQQQQASMEKNQRTGDKSLTQLMKGMEGFANIATNYSPV